MDSMNMVGIAELYEKFKAGEVMYVTLEEHQVRGKRFHFQTDRNANWAWSVLPIPPKTATISQPSDIPAGMYGATFLSVDTMASALAKLTGGSFEVSWAAELAEDAPPCAVYCNGATYLFELKAHEALARAKVLAASHPTCTWVVRCSKTNAVTGVFRVPVPEVTLDPTAVV